MIAKRLIVLVPTCMSLILGGCGFSAGVTVTQKKISGFINFLEYNINESQAIYLPVAKVTPSSNAPLDEFSDSNQIAHLDQGFGSGNIPRMFVAPELTEEERLIRSQDVIAQTTYSLTTAQIQSEANNYQDVSIVDMPNGFVPDTSQPSSITITVLTNTGRTSTQTFPSVYRSDLVGSYPTANSTTTPRPYVPTDMTAVRSFINSATSGASTAKVSLTGDTPMKAASTTASGTYNLTQRSSSSQGITTQGSADYIYEKPCTQCVLQ